MDSQFDWSGGSLSLSLSLSVSLFPFLSLSLCFLGREAFGFVKVEKVASVMSQYIKTPHRGVLV